jgi:hypothetical protein
MWVRARVCERERERETDTKKKKKIKVVYIVHNLIRKNGFRIYKHTFAEYIFQNTQKNGHVFI